MIIEDPWKEGVGYVLPERCPTCRQDKYRPILKPDTRRRTFRNIDEDKIMVPLLKPTHISRDNSGKIISWELRGLRKLPPTIYVYHKRYDSNRKWVQCYIGRIKVREELAFKHPRRSKNTEKAGF